MYSPEEVQQRRADNARQYDLGLLGQLSGDEGLSNVGGQVLKQAMAARTPKITERGTIDPLSGEFKEDPDYIRQQRQAGVEKIEQLDAQEAGRFYEARTKAKEQDALHRTIAAAGAEGRQGAQDARIIRAEGDLRHDYDRMTKDLREEVNATGKITQIVSANAGKRLDAITQQSLVVLLNKFLDPGSVVREGEFDRVVKAQGLEGRAKNLADNILRGMPLNADTINQINGLAQLYSKAADAKLRTYGANYTDIATRQGLDPRNVISDPIYRPITPIVIDASATPRAPGATTGAGAPRKALPLSNPGTPNRVVEE
jgi:hypothetical protein